MEVDSDGDDIEDLDSDMMEEDEAIKGMQAEADMSGSDQDSEDDDDSEDEGPRGVDRLQVSQGIDIPFGVNIPVVSQLAKEAQRREAKSKKDMTKDDVEMEAKETKRKITDFIE